MKRSHETILILQQENLQWLAQLNCSMQKM